MTNPSRKFLAVSDEKGIVRLLATDTGEVLANLEGTDASIIMYLRFSPDGSKLFALEWSQQIQVWDLRRIRAELRKLKLDWNAPPGTPVQRMQKVTDKRENQGKNDSYNY